MDVIKGLKNSKQDLNCISISLVKDNSDFLSSIIVNIVNESFLHGTFPKCLKIAKVIPIFKKGDRSK